MECIISLAFGIEQHILSTFESVSRLSGNSVILFISDYFKSFFCIVLALRICIFASVSLI